MFAKKMILIGFPIRDMQVIDFKLEKLPDGEVVFKEGISEINIKAYGNQDSYFDMVKVILALKNRYSADDLAKYLINTFKKAIDSGSSITKIRKLLTSVENKSIEKKLTRLVDEIVEQDASQVELVGIMNSFLRPSTDEPILTFYDDHMLVSLLNGTSLPANPEKSFKEKVDKIVKAFEALNIYKNDSKRLQVQMLQQFEEALNINSTNEENITYSIKLINRLIRNVKELDLSGFKLNDVYIYLSGKNKLDAMKQLIDKAKYSKNAEVLEEFRFLKVYFSGNEFENLIPK